MGCLKALALYEKMRLLNKEKNYIKNEDEIIYYAN